MSDSDNGMSEEGTERGAVGGERKWQGDKPLPFWLFSSQEGRRLDACSWGSELETRIWNLGSADLSRDFPPLRRASGIGTLT
jgi:hypothetical protein